MTQRTHILVIQTGTPPAGVSDRHGDFAHMMLAQAGLPADAARIVDVHLGGRLDAPGTYRAALVTGSPASVTDREPWSEDTAAWLRDAIGLGLPVFGVCYGHQLMAHALGGQVGYHPAGREAGTHSLDTLPAAADCAWTADLPATFPAHLIHEQTVLALPAGAQVLARSAHEPHQIIRYGERSLSTQYHPEFSAAIMARYLDVFRRVLAREGQDADALLAAVADAPAAATPLQRFTRHWLDNDWRAGPTP